MAAENLPKTFRPDTQFKPVDTPFVPHIVTNPYHAPEIPHEHTFPPGYKEIPGATQQPDGSQVVEWTEPGIIYHDSPLGLPIPPAINQPKGAPHISVTPRRVDANNTVTGRNVRCIL